jgi:hypothetical protein
VPNRPSATIRRGVELSIHTHLIWSYTSHHLISLEEVLLGMNTTMKNSSIFKLSYHMYSNAYELEYSCLHIIIMIYELAYSLYAMILTCSTLILIIHITCMSRIRAKLRWRFIMPLSVPKSFTYRSVGSRTQGDLVVSTYASMVLGYGGTGKYISLSTVEG